MSNTWELIDRTDNDCLDTGTKEEMQREADVRNAEPGNRYRTQYIVRREGYSEENFNG